MRPTTFILLAAFGPLKDGLYRASRALENGERVVFVCFRSDLFKLLLPLRNDSVDVLRFPEGLNFTSGSFFQDCSAIRAFQQELVRRWGGISGASVWAYGTWLSLPPMLATAFFSKKNPVYYNSVYEGRGVPGEVFDQLSTRTGRRIKAKLLSLVTGVPIRICRDWSPAPMLDQEFVTSRFVPVKDEPGLLEPSPLERKLRKTCDAEVVVLFSNCVDYFNADSGEKERTNTLWRNIGELLKTRATGCRVAVKAHPSYNRLPPSWSWMEVLPSDVPTELWDFPRLRVLVADSSMALVDLAGRNAGKTVSFVKLYEARWRNELLAYLENRVGRIDGFHLAESWQDFESHVVKALAPVPNPGSE